MNRKEKKGAKFNEYVIYICGRAILLPAEDAEHAGVIRSTLRLRHSYLGCPQIAQMNAEVLLVFK